MNPFIRARSRRYPRAGLVTFVWLMMSAMPLLAVGQDAQGPLEKPPELLAMQIKHLEADELTSEADQWLARLQDTVKRLNDVKAEIWRENEALKAAEAEADTAAENQQAAQPADKQPEQPDPEIERETELKEASLERLAALREERVQIIDRFKVVLNELSAKLGMTDTGQEQEAVLAYRRYIDSVDAVEVDTSDFQALRSTAASWLVSPEGGQRLAGNVGKFLAIVAGFWLLSVVLGRLTRKAMSFAHGASQILSRFVVNTVRRVTIIVGLLLGLSALEINVTPLVAVIGAAGFVIAFALQNTLSNFASGLMIMLYKPFDIGDFVQTAEVMGNVSSMTLVTTNMITPDNKLLVVPNNELWGKVITNVTGRSERRVDLVFGIGYGDDIALAERLLREVVEANPAVLEDPEPVIAVSELADSSVNLICRPWVKTPDYWTAYWDITRAVKERFDAEGVSIPFPQRDVHVVKEQPAG